MRTSTILALSVMVLSGCSGCPGGSNGRDASAARDADAAAADIRTADGVPDLTDAAQPADAAATTCGGKRTLSPAAVTRKGGVACGSGCRQVTFGDDVTNSFEVENGLLVYAGGAGPAIYLVDLKKDAEQLVRAHPSGKPGCYVAGTNGKVIVYSCQIWESTSAANLAVTLHRYDPATHEEWDAKCIKVTGGNVMVPDYIGVGDDRFAVTMSPSDKTSLDAYLFSYKDSSFNNISKNYGSTWHVRMSGTAAVWTEYLSAKKVTRVALFDTDKMTKKWPDSSAAGQYAPRIHGDKIVWVDHRNGPGNMWNQGNSDIYMYDMTTGGTVAVTKHPAMQENPDVWGDWVVWQDWRNNKNPIPKLSSEYVNSDIYAKNTKTGKVVQLTSLPGLEVRPQVANGKVYFRMAASQQISLFEQKLVMP